MKYTIKLSKADIEYIKTSTVNEEGTVTIHGDVSLGDNTSSIDMESKPTPEPANTQTKTSVELTRVLMEQWLMDEPYVSRCHLETLVTIARISPLAKYMAVKMTSPLTAKRIRIINTLIIKSGINQSKYNCFLINEHHLQANIDAYLHSATEYATKYIKGGSTNDICQFYTILKTLHIINKL